MNMEMPPVVEQSLLSGERLKKMILVGLAGSSLGCSAIGSPTMANPDKLIIANPQTQEVSIVDKGRNEIEKSIKLPIQEADRKPESELEIEGTNIHAIFEYYANEQNIIVHFDPIDPQLNYRSVAGFEDGSIGRTGITAMWSHPTSLPGVMNSVFWEVDVPHKNIKSIAGSQQLLGGSITLSIDAASDSPEVILTSDENAEPQRGAMDRVFAPGNTIFPGTAIEHQGVFSDWAATYKMEPGTTPDKLAGSFEPGSTLHVVFNKDTKKFERRFYGLVALREQ